MEPDAGAAGAATEDLEAELAEALATPDDPIADLHGGVEEMNALDPPTWGEFVEDTWEIYRDPVLCAAVAGIALGFLSVYVVLRRMVFVSAAVTQAAGLGVALAFYAGIHWGTHFDPIYGAVALSLVTVFALMPNPQRLGISRETVLGIAFAITGGAAVLIGSRIAQEAHDIQSILFGTGVLVESGDLRRLMICASVTLTLHVWWFRGMTFASFDPVAARVQGLPVALLNGTLLFTIGAMVGVAARALGALPVFALSTLPAAAALAVMRGRLISTFVAAALIGAAAGVGGYLFAFFREFPVGASQTLVAVLFAVVAVVVRGAATSISPRLFPSGRRRG